MRRILCAALVGAAACLGAVSAGGSSAQGAPNPVLANGAGGVNIPAPNSATPHRRSTGRLSSSLNWSGYAQSAEINPSSGKPLIPYTGVTSTFVVTTVNTSIHGTQYSSDWVGIGGFSDNKLVQAGVEEDNFNGTPIYQAWTEVLPRAEVPLSLAISPGNQVIVTVQETANKHGKAKRWSMVVDDVTTGHSAGRKIRYTTPGSSVEAIHERPCVGNPCSTHLATLATTTNETFDPAYFSVAAPKFTPAYQPLLTPETGATLYDLVMISSTEAPLATPSNTNSHDDGFVVADGSTVPAPPG
jgi:hypothetical protein